MVTLISRRFFLVGVLSVPTLAFARDAKWAVPKVLDGVPNLNQVGPNLYRSAQPTAPGFEAAAKALNIKTVIDLRAFHSDVSLLKDTSIDFKAVHMNAWHITTDEVVAALKLIKAAEAKGPVLVHCQHGADRTGVVIAMYRIVNQGWTKEQALDEMENGGYNFHSIFANIPNFVKSADVAAYKLAIQ
jgi:protein tyrosine/serine phosphatase